MVKDKTQSKNYAAQKESMENTKVEEVPIGKTEKPEQEITLIEVISGMTELEYRATIISALQELNARLQELQAQNGPK